MHRRPHSLSACLNQKPHKQAKQRLAQLPPDWHCCRGTDTLQSLSVVTHPLLPAMPFSCSPFEAPIPLLLFTSTMRASVAALLSCSGVSTLACSMRRISQMQPPEESHWERVRCRCCCRGSTHRRRAAARLHRLDRCTVRRDRAASLGCGRFESGHFNEGCSAELS